MRTVLVLSSIVFLCTLALGQTQIAIQNVTLIDGTDHAPRNHVIVFIKGEHILAIRNKNTGQPKGTQIVDGTGKFLIPGLWNDDLHAVNYEKAKAAFPSLISYGITSVRDMGAPLDDITRLRAQTASGAVVGPRLFIAGPLLEGPVSIRMPLIVALFDESQARDEVRTLKQHRVDYIEVDTTLTPELYKAVSDETRKQSLRLVGHIPAKVAADEVVKAHQENVEHLGGRFLNILIACSTEDSHLGSTIERIYDDLLKAVKKEHSPREPQFTAEFDRKLLATYDERKAQKLFRLYAKNRVWQTPTLVALRTLWDSNKDELKLTDEDIEFGRRIFANDMAVVFAMKQTGVPILAGTDGPYSQGGDTLHTELALLVQAGLTPLQALQSATRDAAEFMGVSQISGTLEPGKFADLILLSSNPLDDISNTRRIDAVFLRGTMFTRDQLTAMRAH